MEVDPTSSAQGHPTHNIGNPPETAVTEGVPQVNGQATAQTEATVPKNTRAETTQQQEGLVEDITGQPDS
jgi:hypothetical protein